MATSGPDPRPGLLVCASAPLLDASGASARRLVSLVTSGGRERTVEVALLGWDGGTGGGIAPLVHRLRQAGVAVHPGLPSRTPRIDSVLCCGFEAAELVVSAVRSQAPGAALVVDVATLSAVSAGRELAATDDPVRRDRPFVPEFGARLVRELNVCGAADAVATSTDVAADLVRSFLGGTRPVVCLGTPVAPTQVVGSRRDIVIGGDFRSRATRADAALCLLASLPSLEVGELRGRTVTLLGPGVDDEVRLWCRAMGARAPGDVDPSPYVASAGVVVVLDDGCGLRDAARSVVGLPVVRWEGPVPTADRIRSALEGADAETITGQPGDGGLSRLLDAAVAGRRCAVAAGWPVASPAAAWDMHYEAVRDETLALVKESPPGAVLVLNEGDPTMSDGAGRHVEAFPGAAFEEREGRNPADAAALVTALGHAVGRGATALVVPATSRWRLHHYPGLADALAVSPSVHAPLGGRRFDLAGAAAAGEAAPVRTTVRRPAGGARIAAGAVAGGPPKIFCIGLTKTGTTSLHRALQELGIRSLHWGPDDEEMGGRRMYLEVLRARREGHRLLHHIGEDFQAYSDIETLSKNFDLADVQYPGSRFILTVRDRGRWLDSRRRHVERNRRSQAVGGYGGHHLDADLDAWAVEWEEHMGRVMSYFAGRPGDLLVLDARAETGFDRLAPFLGLPDPMLPFPHENVDRAHSVLTQ